VAPGDYNAKALTSLSFSKGQTSKTVTVTIKGDKVPEPDEVLLPRGEQPGGGHPRQGHGTGTIINDD